MAARPRKYYPNAFITTGIYTKGKEWMTNEGEEYIGPYHKYIDGFTMTLPNYDKQKSVQLIPYQEQVATGNSKTLIYDKISDIAVKDLNAPKSFYPKPTPKQQKSGFMTRYATQKRNEPTKFAEISEEQYKTITNSAKGINGGLYKGIEFKWKITGHKNDILKDDGSIKEHGVEDTNRRILILLDEKYPGIANYFADLLEFTIYDDIKQK